MDIDMRMTPERRRAVKTMNKAIVDEMLARPTGQFPRCTFAQFVQEAKDAKAMKQGDTP